MNAGDNWTIGEVIRKMRMEQGISGQQLCLGLCSLSTFSRIEADEREPEIMMAEVILERLGYYPDKFEIYTGKKEFDLYDLRAEMRLYQEEKKYKELKVCMETYRKMQGALLSRLEEQFLFRMQGFLEWGEGNVEKGIHWMKLAIAVTVLEEKKGGLEQYILSSEELELFYMLVKMYIQQEQLDEARILLQQVYQYLEQKPERKVQKVKIYIKVAYQMALILLRYGEADTAYVICKNALALLSDMGSLHQLPELWRCMGNCVEILTSKNSISKEWIMECFQRSYYLYRVKGQMEEAEEVKKYLEEWYQWECIK